MKTETKERPILFSGPMVLAILEGHKTQTRRIVKPQPDVMYENISVQFLHPVTSGTYSREQFARLCPYGQPGDRLWVRETWFSDPHAVHYKADYDGDDIAFGIDPERPHIPRRLREHGGWRASIHMPRWASRITLEIVSVRVERLQDISESDALAEGVTLPDWTCTMYDGIYRDAFQRLWESIYGVGSWEKNPYVWGISFVRLI